MKKILALLLFVFLAVATAAPAVVSWGNSAFAEPGPEDQEGPQLRYPSVENLRESILLSSYGTMDIHELLQLALVTTDPTRYEMTLALLLRKEQTLPLLQERLKTADSDEEKHGLLMLIQGKLYWEELAAEITPLLHDDSASERVRARAATALSRFQKKEALPAIRNLLESAEEIQVKQLAALALGHLRDLEAKDLVEQQLLQDDSPFARLTAAKVLAMLGSTVGEQEALALSNHERFDVRIRAAEALSYIGTSAAMSRLQQLEHDCISPGMSYEIAEYIGLAMLENLGREDALQMLEVLLQHETDDPNILPPRWAFIYLAEHFSYEAEDLLTTLSKKPGPLMYPAMLALLKIDARVHMIPYRQRLLPVAPLEPYTPEVTIYIDGVLLVTDVAPMIIDGRTMVPMRSIFEALGIHVQWFAETRTIVATKENTIIELIVGSTTATVNGEEVILDVPPTIVEGRTLVPVRFIAESTGQIVEWDGENRRVLITSP